VFWLRSSTVILGIHKVQYAPLQQGCQSFSMVCKDFMLCPGELELEVTLDKKVSHTATCFSDITKWSTSGCKT
jgi:hypothetical protein